MYMQRGQVTCICMMRSSTVSRPGVRIFMISLDTLHLAHLPQPMAPGNGLHSSHYLSSVQKRSGQELDAPALSKEFWHLLQPSGTSVPLHLFRTDGSWTVLAVQHAQTAEGRHSF